MATCVINKNEYGVFTDVKTRDGAESVLFDKIMGIPFVKTLDDAVKIYSNVLTDKFKSVFGDWERRVTANPQAVNKIKSQILDHPNSDNIIRVASTMQNPVLVRKMDRVIGDRQLYTTSVEEGNGDDLFLYDETLVSDMDLQGDAVADDSDSDIYEAESLSGNPNPVIDLTLVSGETVKAISASQQIDNISALQYEDAVSPMTYSNGEPKLYFVSPDGGVYDDYADALQNSGSGNIEAGFISGDVQRVSSSQAQEESTAGVVEYDGKIKLNDRNSFIKILDINTDSNIQTEDGLTNYLIRKGYLSASKVKYDGRYYLTGTGEEGGTKTYNANVAISYIRLIPGFSNSRVYDDGRVEILYEDRNSRVLLATSDGFTYSYSKEYIKTMLKEGRYEELKSEFPDIDLLIACIFQDDNQIFKSSTEQVIENEKARDLDIRRGMMKILSNLGISVVGMSEYIERFKTRFGVEPSAKALADLGNKVIALAEGSGVEDLTEETAHFLIETYEDQDRVRELLPEVESTEQWDRYSKQYYDIYSKQHSGDKLTEIVRREVLGKILRDEFLNRFNKAGVESESQSFYQRLAEMLVDIVRRIQSFFSSDMRNDFDAFVQEMADSALSDNPNAFDITNLDDADFTLYSVADEKAMKMFSDARTVLKAQLRNARRAKSGASQQLKGDLSRVEKSINELSGEINDLNVASTITNLVATTEAQTNYLNKLVKAYHNEVRRGNSEAMFDLTDQSNLDNINSLMAPMINQLRGFIDTDPDLKLDPNFKKQIIARIDSVNAKIAALNAEVSALRKIDNSSLLKRLLQTFNVPEDGRAFIVDFINGVMKDVSWITRWFGTLEHSKNPILGMLMNFISYNNYNANVRTQDDMREVISRAERSNFDVNRMESLLQKDGAYYSSYLMSEVDYVKFRKDFERAQAEAIKAAVPGVEADVDTILKDGVEIDGSIFKPNIHGVRLNKLTDEQISVYEEKMNKWLEENTERRYTKEYYDVVQSVYDKAAVRENGEVRPISREALDFMRSLSARRYQVKRRFMDASGRTNWDRLYKDIDALEELKDINRSKKMASSIVDPRTGEQKEGRELELAEDLRAIDKAWSDYAKENGSNKVVKDEFLDELRAIQRTQGSGAAYDFLIANSNIRFSDDFWNALGDSSLASVESILDEDSPNFRKDFDGEPLTRADMNTLRSLVDEVRELQKTQKEIMRAYYETDTPGEIDYDNMPQEAKQKVKQLQDEIQYRNSSIRAITKDASYESAVETEYTNNQAFERALEDSVDDVLTFCKKHATTQNQSRMDSFRHKIDNIKKSKGAKFSPAEKRHLFNLGILNSEEDINPQLQYYVENNPQVLDNAVEEYAKTLVLPYFKRFAPKGYNEWLSDIKTKDVWAMARRVLSGKGDGVESFLTIEPAREWQTEDQNMESKYKNENYKESSDYGYYQPKTDKYRNEEYFSRFGIGVPGGVATKNVEDWQMIKDLVELKRKALGENGYNEGERPGYNLYEIPQISKSTIEKLYQVKDNPKLVLRNALRDMASVRVDDPIYGQASDLDVEGVDMTQFKVIPKYYLRELGEKSDVSHDLVRSYTLFMLQANMYDEKMKTIGDVMGLQQMLLNSKFEKGVIPQNSNSYAMFKEWMESHFYGVRENNKKLEIEVLGKKIDVSKLAGTFDKFVRYHNLALSPAVAVTGAMTGQLNTVIEGAVGQYINIPSLRFADRELLKMTSGYISDIGTIDRQNKLYVLGERMGIYSIAHRTASAGYNRAIRVLGDGLGFKMMDVLNYPLAPKMMISVMDDTRMAEDGKFYRYSSFSRLLAYNERQAGRTISSKEIKARWEALKDRSLYNILDVKDGQVVIKEGFDEKTVMRQMRVTQREVTSLNNICDGVLSPEDKSSASRNWMFNFTMAHRGWFQIAFQRRWKAKGYNFSTNQIEEGSNRTVWRYLMKSLSLLKEGKTKELFNAINSKWDTMSYWERTNLYRSVVDVSVFMLATLAYAWAMSYDDDDEESSWMGQFITYNILRTVNEEYSQLPGLLEINAIESLYNPFPVMAKLRDLVMAKNWSLDEVQSGTYEGETKLWRLFAKQTFLKQWYAMKSAESVKATKKGWLLNNPVMFFTKPSDDEDDN